MRTAEIARQVGVTEQDINSLLDMVSNSIKQDGACNALMEMNPADRVEFVNAYIQSEVKKFSEFCVTLMTNTEKRKAFDLYLLEQLSD